MRRRKYLNITEEHHLVEFLSPVLLAVSLVACVIVSDRFPADKRAAWGLILYGVSAVIILTLMSKLDTWLKQRRF